MKRTVLYLLVCLNSVYIAGQDESIIADEYISEIMSMTDEFDYESVVMSLQSLAESPVKINSGDEEEIARLFFLSEFQVRVLADHVRRTDKIATIFEVALLTAFDRKTAMLMSPFVSFEDVSIAGRKASATNSFTGTMMVRLPEKDEDAAGIRSLIRFRHDGQKISYGLTAEQDPGEKVTFRDSYGPDFLSGHIMFEGKGFPERVIIGDYSLRFGEGLIFNNNAGLGLRVVSPSYISGRSVVSPYVSTEENNYFRGVACVLGSLTRGLVVFASSHNIDARIDYDSDSTEAFVSNLVRGGIHNTVSGIEAKDALNEIVAGIHLSAGAKNTRVGLTASATFFSLPFRPDSSDAGSLFSFRGDRLVNLGADFRTGTGRVLLFSDAAISLPGSWSAITGVRMTPAPRVTINILARHFSRDYYSLHSGTYRAGSSANNETGMVANVQIEAARHLFVGAGADVYRFPWLKYRASAPTFGRKTEIRGEYIPDEDLYLRISWLTLITEHDTASETGVAGSTAEKKEQLAGQFTFSPSPFVRLTTRAGVSFLPLRREHGWMLCQDITISPSALPLRFYLRYSLFTTDSYASRLYAWENDMLSAFSIPALYGEGSRAAFMITWKPFMNVELRGKYSATAREEEQNRTVTQEVRVQVRMVF